MQHPVVFATALALAGFVAASTHLAGQAPGASHLAAPSREARLAAIRRAQVWVSTDVPSMDLRAGPTGPGSFEPNQTITCDHLDKQMAGSTPKFECALSLKDKDEIKVKYGHDNGEVYGEVAATRLLWALGFGADRMYPVRVDCRGCSPDPWSDRKTRQGHVLFDPAAVERKMKGKTFETHADSGWTWPELDLVDEAAGGAPRAQRDALKLLAVLIQHTDSKAAQQRLMCLAEQPEEHGETCAEPFMMINDLGMTFGHANMFNRASVGSVNLEQWSRAAVWKDPQACVGNISKSHTGTLDKPLISEAGRSFLANLLAQLSDAQLRDLFEVARFPQRGGESIHAATAAEWVDAFKRKRDEIANRTCPS
jgi:hypothetical protein